MYSMGLRYWISNHISNNLMSYNIAFLDGFKPVMKKLDKNVLMKDSGNMKIKIKNKKPPTQSLIRDKQNSDVPVSQNILHNHENKFFFFSHNAHHGVLCG